MSDDQLTVLASCHRVADIHLRDIRTSARKTAGRLLADKETSECPERLSTPRNGENNADTQPYKRSCEARPPSPWQADRRSPDQQPGCA